MARTTSDIQADLTAAYESRRVALTAQSYSMNSGQGSQSVQRASLKEINETIKQLTQELDEANEQYGGNYSASYERY